MLFRNAREALEHDLLGLRTSKRVAFLRAHMDFVVALYAKAINDAERDRFFEEKYGDVKFAEDVWPWLKPLPTPRDIFAMSRDEARKFQGLCRFKDGTLWISHDNRFLDGGKGLGFERAYHAAWHERAPSKDEFAECEYLHGDERPKYFEAENEVTQDDMLQYQEGVENGTIAIEVGKGIMTKELVNTYKHAIQIESVEWPSVEHFILAQQFSEIQLRENIRKGRTLTEIRKAIRKTPIRSDWPEVRDELMKSALNQKFQNPYLHMCLLHTVGFKLKYKSPDQYWGGARNRMGELLMELRDMLQGKDKLIVRIVRKKSESENDQPDGSDLQPPGEQSSVPCEE